MRDLARFVAALLFVVAEASAQTVARLPEGERLELTVQRPNHIAGVFKHADVVVRFDSTRSEKTASLILRDRHDALIYSASAEGRTYRIEFYGGKLIARGEFSPVVTKPAPEARTEGDVKSATAFTHSAEYKVLPFLSRALGASAMTGVSFPASLYLHGLGLASAQENKVEAADLPEPAGNKARDRKPPCPDPAADPTKCKNDCFGMCGPGCNCWKRICGDCCMHAGCLTHDISARLCDCGGLSHISDCLKKWTALTFISTGGEGPPCMLVKGCKNPPKCD